MLNDEKNLMSQFYTRSKPFLGVKCA